MSFMEIFQPGLKHLREERQRQQHDIAYPLVDIDLDAGTATIAIPARANRPETPSAVETDPVPRPTYAKAAERSGHGRK